MTIILRLVAILALLALVLMSWGGAAAAAAALLDAPIPVPGLGQDTVSTLGHSTWIDVGLWGAAGLFFLISAVRLMRATQGWFLWLLGFACYLGRWVMAQGGPQQALEAAQGIDAGAYVKPAGIVADLAATEAQLAFFVVMLALGLIVFIVDLADKAERKKHES